MGRHLGALAAAAGAIAAIATGCGGGGEARRVAAPRPHTAAEHLRAIAALTAAHGGTRAAGSPGYGTAVRYVTRTLEAAGYEVTRQAVSFPFFDVRSPSLVRAGGRTLRRGRDVRTTAFSGAGDVRAPLRVVRRGRGCTAAGAAVVRAGEVALVPRGGCTLLRKAVVAARAGAAAVLVADDRPAPTAFRGTLGGPAVDVPVLALSQAAGRSLAAHAGRRVRVRADVVSERREADTVLAERPGARRGRILMAGAHLDSVPEGPGVNDDGSGVAAVLAVAERRRAQPGLRFAFWAAEEDGLYGSRRYVAALDRGERDRIAGYVNADMVASPNPSAEVYGTRALRERLRRAVRATGRRPRPADVGGLSDHAPFGRVGIPYGGLFTGASERAPNGRPHDPCYHRRCDDLGNVDLAMLADMTDALDRVLREGAR
ncbi:MAG TPA: M20/M25/M40 family metallo-hydrolase [Capillimicrobium sp.]|nr:M20/M25/M40 family metallo-hydrolase [Capillimicrobium sp.]